MKFSLAKHCILALIFFTLIGLDVSAQTLRPFRLPRDPKKQSALSAELSFGFASPQGRSGLREFWLAGPSAAITGLLHIDREFAIGLGADFSIHYFDANGLAVRWPAVVLVEKPNLLMSNVSLHGVYTFLPDAEVRPFVSVELGVQFIPRARYQRIIDGVRYTYYNVGGTNRLALGIAVGANYEVDDDFGIHAELKNTLVHNDPNVSHLLHLRAGIQYKF
jgi:hypothetical protein